MGSPWCFFMANGITLTAMLAGQAAGRSVETLEGLAREGRLERLISAFAEKSAVQCGFCTPGFLVAAYDYIRRRGSPDPDSIRLGLDGNICRCTGYIQIIEAVAKRAGVPMERVFVNVHRYGNMSAATATSTMRAMVIGFPLSRLSSQASSSALASII